MRLGMNDRHDETAIASILTTLAGQTPAAKTFCPSDAARTLAGPAPEAWGRAMIPVRKVAVQLAMEGKLVIYRKGKPVDPLNFKGVYRLGAPRID